MTLCLRVLISVCLICSNNLGSVTLIFFAKFHDKWMTGTMDLYPSSLLYSYRSTASWYCFHVRGPTFHAMLLHQPWTQKTIVINVKQQLNYIIFINDTIVCYCTYYSLNPVDSSGADPHQVPGFLNESVDGDVSFEQVIQVWPPRTFQVM